MRVAWQIIKETYTGWMTDRASRLSAALSYYTAVTIAPLLVLVVAAIGAFYGENSAQARLAWQIRGLVGVEAARAAEAVVQSADQPTLVGIAGVLSLLTVMWGMSNVFVELQDSLNTIWGVELKPDAGIIDMIRGRFLSFGMVLVIGFLLLVSLVLTTVLSAMSTFLGTLLPEMALLWQAIDLILSLGVTTLLFALIYKVLPDAKFAWRDVWMGATFTAVLFTIGKWLLGLYLGNTSLSSAYGAAGSLVILLIWIFYSAQIFFMGAEFTQVIASHFGEGVAPDEKAQPIRSPQPGEGKLD